MYSRSMWFMWFINKLHGCPSEDVFVLSITGLWWPIGYIWSMLRLSWYVTLSIDPTFELIRDIIHELPEVRLPRPILQPYPWASYQIRKIAGCACAGNAGNVFPRRRFQRKPIVSDPGMHHGTCVTHVPWCMSGSFTCGDGENVPGIPGACAPAILRIWQEAHAPTTAKVEDQQHLKHKPP